MGSWCAELHARLWARVRRWVHSTRHMGSGCIAFDGYRADRLVLIACTCGRVFWHDSPGAGYVLICDAAAEESRH